MEAFSLTNFVLVFLRTFVDVLGWGLQVAIFARVILSWIRIPLPYAVERWLFDVTEPILGPIRRALPTTLGLDFSPFIAILVIGLAQRVLVQFLTVTI